MPEDNPTLYIRPLKTSDRNWVAQFMDEHWSSTKIVSRGKVYYAHLLPGFVAYEGEEPSEDEDDESLEEGDPIGLVTYNLENEDCEIITINSVKSELGVGAALIEAVKAAASESGIKRIWLITTNDNMHALRFYQRNGFHLVAVYPDALAESRKLKPQIPLVGKNGIPLRDEIELEIRL